MAHIHDIKDKQGNVVDRKYYCSDSCNTYDNQDNYKGWNGCNEICLTQYCDRKGCGNIIKGVEND
jgi:hypothetical protein